MLRAPVFFGLFTRKNAPPPPHRPSLLRWPYRNKLRILRILQKKGRIWSLKKKQDGAFWLPQNRRSCFLVAFTAFSAGLDILGAPWSPVFLKFSAGLTVLGALRFFNIAQELGTVYPTEYIFYCKRGILFLSSSKILTPHPPLRPASLSSPRNKGALAGRRGGWGGHILEDERNRISLLQ